jgi:hypothetical protein
MSKDSNHGPAADRSLAPEGGVSRLPCRGCLPDCKDLAVCDGRPWRTLGPDASKKAR